MIETQVPVVTANSPSTHIVPGTATVRTSYDDLNQRLYQSKRQVKEMRSKIQRLTTELQAARLEIAAQRKLVSSTAYRLGNLLIKATKSPAALLRLPMDLWKLSRSRGSHLS